VNAIFYFVIAAFCFSSKLYAQVVTNFNNRNIITLSGKFKKNFQHKDAFTIPPKNIQALIEKENTENKTDEA
jgi:hypothetical protein